MTDMIKNKIFGENSIELLPAYFILADANIHMAIKEREREKDYS